MWLYQGDERERERASEGRNCLTTIGTKIRDNFADDIYYSDNYVAVASMNYISVERSSAVCMQEASGTSGIGLTLNVALAASSTKDGSLPFSSLPPSCALASLPQYGTPAIYIYIPA